MKRFPSRAARLLRGITLAACALAAAGAQAQAWPTQQPIRLIVPASAGGSLDTLTRPLAQHLGEALKQAVVVENRGGAAGMVGAEHVAKSAPDGYTFLMGAIHHAIIPGVYAEVPYDSKNGLVGVAHIGETPNMVIVSKRVPVETPQELVAWIKANPGKVSYGTGGAGALHHVATEMFKAEVGTPDMAAIHYRGSSQAIRDILAGHIQVMFETMPTAAVQVRAKRVKAVAVTSPQRTEAFPDVPTLAETVMPGFQVMTWYGVFAPKGTPPEVVSRMHEEIARALQREDMREVWKTAGVEAVNMPQPDFQRFWVAEVDRWSGAARKFGITAN